MTLAFAYNWDISPSASASSMAMEATVGSEHGGSPRVDEICFGMQPCVSSPLSIGSLVLCIAFSTNEAKLASGMFDVVGVSAFRLTGRHQP